MVAEILIFALHLRLAQKLPIFLVAHAGLKTFALLSNVIKDMLYYLRLIPVYKHVLWYFEHLFLIFTGHIFTFLETVTKCLFDQGSFANGFLKNSTWIFMTEEKKSHLSKKIQL